MEPIIEVKNVDLTYYPNQVNKVQALQKINLKIYPGEFIDFFGPSGCGKSSLLYIFAGLEKPTSGEVVVEQKNLTAFSAKETDWYRKTRVGFVFQTFNLISSLSVLHNVTLPWMLQGRDRKEGEKKAHALLERFGLGNMGKRPVQDLSGGQQQRVGVARALINDPAIILADEPTGSLDSRNASQIIQILQELNEKDGKTVILVSHDAMYLNYAHRIFYMHDGAIVNTKMNHAVTPELQSILGKEPEAQMPKELALLAKSYTGLSAEQVGVLLVPFKAREILLELLFSMSSEDIERLQKQICNWLMHGLDNRNIEDKKEFFHFLDLESDLPGGGLGLDKRTASRLAEKVDEFIQEIRFLEEEEKKAPVDLADSEANVDEEVNHIVHYLLKAFALELDSALSMPRLQLAVKYRLKDKFDRESFQETLDSSIEKGGVGLDRRIAKKAASRLELLMLGKYQ